jgi:hypothetical protein
LRSVKSLAGFSTVIVLIVAEFTPAAARLGKKLFCK